MKYRSIAILTAITSLISICSLSAWGRRDIPDDHLAYPVLVELDTKATATGFYLDDGKFVYLVTAKHVLFNKSKALKSNGVTLTSYSSDPLDSTRGILRLDLKAMNEAKNIRYHKTHDVAIIRIAQLLGERVEGQPQPSKLFNGVEVKEKIESGVLQVGIESTKKFDEVLIGNEVYIFGYPTSLGLKKIPQIDYDQPLLRRGIVAGKNKSLKTIILDCPGYKGNSGGPVVQVEEVKATKIAFNLIGVISQFVPCKETTVVKETQSHSDTTTTTVTTISNSGYSVAIPIELVLELLWKE